MFTACPHCHTRFRIQAAQLKAAQGQVRCGRCETVFDAFATLEEETPAPLTTPATPAEPAIEAAPSVTETPTVAAAEEPVEMSLEAAVLEAPEETPSITVDGVRADRPAIDDLFAELLGSGPLPEPPAPESGATRAPPQLPAFPADIGPLPPPHHAEPPHPWRTAGWTLGALLLGLLLVAQIAHANRMVLSENLVVGSSVRAFYAAIGAPLSGEPDASSWEVSGVNVTSDPRTPGVLSITGALENRGASVQPWPLLRVQLTDRYGEALRGRDFKPAEYLPETQVNVLLAPDMATRFRIDIVDPGADAVGFSLTPCLDTPAGQVCAAPGHD